jgi:hypothetical protein
MVFVPYVSPAAGIEPKIVDVSPDFNTPGQMRFAKVVVGTDPYVIKIEGQFNSDQMPNTFDANCPRAYFAPWPKDAAILKSIDCLCPQPFTQAPALKKDTIILKLKRKDNAFAFTNNISMQANTALKDEYATITLGVGYYFNSEKNVAGPFYTVMDINFK